jgi:hypothetical protein
MAAAQVRNHAVDAGARSRSGLASTSAACLAESFALLPPKPAKGAKLVYFYMGGNPVCVRWRAS